MKNAGWFSPKVVRTIAGSIGLAVLLTITGVAPAQDAAAGAQPTAPKGYTLHESIDMGGNIANINGSGSMYNTLVNMHSGPRVLGESFELRALPETKHTLVDALSAFSNGWGGLPNNFATLSFHKGNLYEFSGTFRRDRQYFDYDLLGNPNIPSGQSIPIGSASSPSGYYPWAQVNQSPFLYNTVRRMTDTSLTLFPLSKVTYRAGYSHYTFEGPSLTPSGYEVGVNYSLILREYQRNSTDDFFGAIDWKPVEGTKLTFEEQVDHYKADSFFTMPTNGFRTVQEPNGALVTILTSYDSLTPSLTCNSAGLGGQPTLSAPNTPGGPPVINPACNVVSSYLRSQPTRILYPTEIFRFQSTSIRNISMNGDVRYTDANMNLPNYYENFQGLSGTTRTQIYGAHASAKRKVTAVDYAIEWQPTRKLGFDDQLTFSNVQQPGAATYTTSTNVSTPTGASDTINYGGALTTVTGGAIGIGHDFTFGVPLPGFFGQRFVTNDVTASWYGWSRATVSLTYRHQNQRIATGLPHADALVVTTTPTFNNPTDGGTVTINQDGGIFNVSVRPDSQWNISGSAELLYADNVFTPVAPRQLQHYRVHTLYRPKPWSTISGSYNDIEIHNNTNNTGTTPLDGPLDHVAHTRSVGLGAALNPNEHYAFNLNYGYSDVYTATNICYLGKAAGVPGNIVVASTPGGTACPGAANRDRTYDFGPARDFMDAPSQYVSASVTLSPNKTIHSNVGYNVNYVDGSRFYNDARDVAGSLHSTYQSPFVNVAWTVRHGFIWSAQYNYYGYGEGGPSGAPYCSTSDPTPTTPATVIPCSSSTLASAGIQTGLNLPSSGETAPRNFHTNLFTLGFHYEF
jgi:hypothetical protein